MLAVLLGTAVLVGLVVVLGRSVVDDLLSCSPPGRRAQVVQEEFVRAHVADAHDLSWFSSDCDDAGTGFLTFSTALSPADTRDAFLADRRCADTDPSEPDAYGVTCRSGSATVDVVVEQAAGGSTGELALP